MFRLLAFTVKYSLTAVAWMFILATWAGWTTVWVAVGLVSFGQWWRTPRPHRTLGLRLKW
jgi:hypothetical protein